MSLLTKVAFFNIGILLLFTQMGCKQLGNENGRRFLNLMY